MTEQQQELLDIVAIAQKVPQSILDKVTELFRYFNYDLAWNDKYVHPQTMVVYDERDSIYIYKFVPEEPIPCYEQVYVINLKLCRINGDSYYDIKRRINS